MTTGIKTIIYPVTDIARAKALYGELLGRAPTMDEAYYVHFDVDDLEVGLDPNGHSKGLTAPVGYWQVDDIDKSFQLLLDSGAHPVQAVFDVGGGRRIASVRDADDNTIGLIQLQ